MIKDLPVNRASSWSATAGSNGGALAYLARHAPSSHPAHLDVCLGLDTAKGDKTGTWPLHGNDLHELGRLVGGISQPVAIVQEGGCDNRSLGATPVSSGMQLPPSFNIEEIDARTE